MANRMSMYSLASDGASRPAGQQSSQVSTTTLLNAVHNVYLSSQPYRLDSATSLVVNTWLTATQAGPDGSTGGTVDAALAARAWEHARRRAEDGCIILGSLHHSTPSILVPFLSALPMKIPTTLFTALNAIQPFLRCVTPSNPSAARQSALAVTLTLNLPGNLTGATIALSQSGIDTVKGLLNLPREAGYRAFDAFYYLLTSASTPAEREFLGLRPASTYKLLANSGTYDPPSYLPTADDAAAADDFRNALKEIGIKGSNHRNLLSTLTGLLKLGDCLGYDMDEDALEEICEDVGGLLGVEPEVLAQQLTTDDRTTFIGGLYEALVDWVISKANQAITAQLMQTKDGDGSSSGRRGDVTPNTSEENGDTVNITVVEVPDPALGKAIALRSIFDDSQGINSETKEDGVEVTLSNSSITREMQSAVGEVAPDLDVMTGPAGRERQHALEKREEILERVAHAADDDGFVKKLLFPVAGQGINLGKFGRFDLSTLLSSSRLWFHLSLHPTDESPASLAALPSITSAWSAGTVSRQLRAWRLSEWANRRNKQLDFTSDFDFDEFVRRYRPLGCKDGKDGIESWIMEKGWSNGEVIVGHERVWMRENAWWEAESMLDVNPTGAPAQDFGGSFVGGMPGMLAAPQAPFPLETGYSANSSGFFPPMDGTPNGSVEGLMHQRNYSHHSLGQNTVPAQSLNRSAGRNAGPGDYGLGQKGDNQRGIYYDQNGEYIDGLDPDMAKNMSVQTRSQTAGRRIWVAIVWALTFWIPSPLLTYVGRMKRPDVRMAWREKLVLCFFILLMNAFIVFWIIGFGKLLCPNMDKAWSQDEISTHKGQDDFWVSIHGKVYDISSFWRLQHSTSNIPVTSDLMLPLAGLNLDEYFVPPLVAACQGLGIDQTIQLSTNASNTPQISPQAIHTSGYYQTDPQSGLKDVNWYGKTFLPKIQEYYHGDLVWSTSFIASDGLNNNHPWFIYNGRIYDLTDYMYTIEFNKNLPQYQFLNKDLINTIQAKPGQDLTPDIQSLLRNSQGNVTENTHLLNSLNCIDNSWYVGIPDFRETARCQVNNYLLLAFTIIIAAVILTKFLSALQFGSKRRPAPQDKFVICQVPAYTEGEDSLRKALDSLTALQYDNKRKLICVICDGVITGAGNDRPTPKIVLDILGVDPKIDPPALPFKSVGTGSEQLNYGKVYSGLYEFEGNVVPYIVVVKMGKESEQSGAKPGNRGKRDSQILLMSFLNRVHHRGPMNPLELEMFHQINNIIGVDPELYEYLLMVDADTCVREDSLNRLVAACANDAKIAGICGETSLQNEERSWWTMIQVYEYFISHHMAKAFESLFGSVTCLPGCFSMYRLRTADRGKPLIISDAVIREYSDGHVDTLHKKNLLSLGEDRYLTTLMTKHFPFMSYKFVPDAYCQTAAPERWSVLLSQRRRWINSTIHNLAELMWLKEMCGFCCFSMRFVVFIDLLGTLVLPATCVYIGWLIYTVATHTGQFPIISIALLAAVYGLQALIFILKRQWQHVGWMIIYILAFPFYSFVLPIYSFWNQDNFTWGNTRIVIGESGSKKVIATEDEGFNPRSIPLQRWDDYALTNNLPGRRGNQEKGDVSNMSDIYAAQDDMKSVYSSVRQPSVLTGMPNNGNAWMPPQSPAPFAAGPGQLSRNSTFGMGSPYTDAPMANRQSMVSVGRPHMHQTQVYPDAQGMIPLRSMSNTSPAQLIAPSPGLSSGRNTPRASMVQQHPPPMPALPHMPSMGGLSYNAGAAAARQSTLSFDYQRGNTGPDDLMITEAIQGVLREVDLDTVTKKQVRALVEQRLQTELVGERRTFLDRTIDAELASM